MSNNFGNCKSYQEVFELNALSVDLICYLIVHYCRPLLNLLQLSTIRADYNYDGSGVTQWEAGQVTIGTSILVQLIFNSISLMSAIDNDSYENFRQTIFREPIVSWFASLL